jgi:cellulose synthase/poly-beta-1,6-N-acetylglucosamine synthase-like glycosyltransferase
MIDVIITSYNEPKATLHAVKIFLQQYTKKDMRVTVVDPFPEVGTFLHAHIKDPRFVFYPDPGEGKSYALNLLFQEYGSTNKEDLFILTDGDVHVSANTVREILAAFKDSKVGCVTGKPVSLDGRETKYGFWAHVAFAGIHRVRDHLSRSGTFLECSGYLFAIRKNVILDFPLETSEDSIIPYLFWKKGYGVRYVPEAEVYVKNPSTWKDWLAQKVRNVKAHENLQQLAPDMPRTKTLWHELKHGGLYALTLPRNPQEFLWLLQLYPARLYLYIKAFTELRAKKRYGDGWRGEATTESTKTLD